MSEKWLFGAEINRIQDTVFRASMQRQVVGGSRLLVAFGDEATRKAQQEYGALADGVLVGGRGGTFRLVFQDQQKAQSFGNMLANAYHLLLDGAITVADPQRFDDAENAPSDSTFAAANEALANQLQIRKRTLTFRTGTPHAPTTAYCQSSGIGLAAQRDFPIPGQGETQEEQKQYLAATAYRKKEAGYKVKDGDDPFLRDISLKLAGPYIKAEWIKRPESAAQLDPGRSNVAYLVADGNNMGKYFSLCNRPQDLKALSAALDDVVKAAIAFTASYLLNEKVLRLVKEQSSSQRKLPFMPLIVAGDDIFMLTPAPHALHFARIFCLAFEKMMAKQKIVTALQAQYAQKHQEHKLPSPTMAAAVVFCKQSYPYHLAHQCGEALLKATKRVIKTVAVSGGGWHSAVSFDVLMGSELARSQENDARDYRPSLTTYWANSQVSDQAALKAALPLKQLHNARELLADERFPNKRLAELRALYTADMIPNKLANHWESELARLRKRIRATDGTGEQLQLLYDALRQLGDPDPARDNPGCWRDIDRAGEKYKGHGILDVLAAWPYLGDLAEPNWGKMNI